VIELIGYRASGGKGDSSPSTHRRPRYHLVTLPG
jgi:hypothetical protein